MAADEFRIIVESENKLSCQCPGDFPRIEFEREEEDQRAFDLARRTIEVFNSWLSNDQARDRDTMSVIGSHLYTLLFPSNIDTAFRLVWEGRIRNASGNPLRVVLEFRRDAAWLAELPWEFLYLPDTPPGLQGFFLCAQSELILTRTVRLNPQPPSDPRSDQPVRILVVLSQPRLEDAVSDGLVKELEGLSKSIPGRIQLRTHLREGMGDSATPGPTRQDFRRWIADPTFPPDIVHFLGHGRYPYNAETRLEKGELALVRADNGEADWCSDKDFAGFFDRARPPKLVFLHACEGGKTASYRGFKGLALSLIGVGVPNVVAMQYPIENVVATRFAGEFYKTLLAGAPIDAAVQNGRKTLGTELNLLTERLGGSAADFSDRRFGSPIVFVQAWLGLCVFGRNADTAATSQTASVELPDALLCPYPGCQKYHKRDMRFCDSGKGALKTCVECGKLLQKEALVCSYCNANQQLVAVPATAAAVAGEGNVSVHREAAERFRAAADSSPTHGSSTFGGWPKV